MTSSLPSAEVAADFRDALQDLRINSRPEISNLTVIAKENTEHAQAISRELEQHITSTRTRAEWKLPALYVLDSIVKNVGTPYTVYLGRNLRSIFFTAYQVADPQMRKAMDALFKTWQQPVPESLDPRPVFEPEVTRPIAEALKQYREKLAQHTYPGQQPAYLQRPPVMQPQQWRNTPTPPQAGYGPPLQLAQQFGQHFASSAAVPSPLGQNATPVQNGLPFGAPQTQWPTPVPAAPNVEQVKADLNRLIVSTTMEMTKNPGSAQQTSGLLTTLLSLQNILQAGNLSAPELQQVAAQVSRISGVVPQPSATAPPVLPPQHTPQPGQVPQLPPQPPQLEALAALLRQTGTPSVSTPPMPIVPLAVPPPAPSTPPVGAPSTAQLSSLLASLQPQPTPTPQQPPSAPQQIDLFASLRAAGLVPGSALPAATPVPDPTVRVRSPINLLQSLAGPPLRLETSSLKVPRPHLVSRLYEAKPDQCRQCGKRFAATEPGKKAKNAHMDWHFSINTRIAEASKSVINRSWYISERDWISYREVDPSSPHSNGGGGNSYGAGGLSADGSTNGGGGGGGGGDSANPSPSKKQRIEHVVPVPTDVSEVNKVCPICQERFEVSWHDEMQTPVWRNAVRIGKKVYHKSCYDEVAASTRGAGAGKGRDSPSVLGKRKLGGAG